MERFTNNYWLTLTYHKFGSVVDWVSTSAGWLSLFQRKDWWVRVADMDP
jgi:hypothetical protein